MFSSGQWLEKFSRFHIEKNLVVCPFCECVHVCVAFGDRKSDFASTFLEIGDIRLNDSLLFSHFTRASKSSNVIMNIHSMKFVGALRCYSYFFPLLHKSSSYQVNSIVQFRRCRHRRRRNLF